MSARTADATAEFFQHLAERPQPLLEKAEGTVRLEIVDGKRVESVLIRLDRGRVAVSDEADAADLTLRAPRATFDGIARGTINAVTAMLSGAMGVEGDLELAVLLQRVLPDPPKRGRRATGKASRGAKR